MILVVVFGHGLLPYLTVPRSFKDQQTHVGFDVMAVFLYGFALHAFFVTTGFSAALLYDRRGAAGLLRNRFQRIFLPLLAVYPVLAPITNGAYVFARQTARSGSLQAGIDALMLGDWIRWSRAYHLWFLVALLLYTLLAVGLRSVSLQIASGAVGRIKTFFRSVFASRWCAPIVALFMAAPLIPAYTLYDGDATTWPMQLTLFGFFLLGWILHTHRDVLPAIGDRGWQSIGIALATLPLAAWSTRQRLLAGDDPELMIGLIAGFTNSILAVFMTFGLLGVFHSRLNRPSAIGGYLSDASYWIFLIHFPVVIAVGGLLAVTSFPAAIKYLLAVAVFTPIVFGIYHFGLRTTRFGGLLKSQKHATATARGKSSHPP